MRLIGICGVARAGKDTLYLCLKDAEPDREWRRMAFADELKNECEDFLLENTGISPFTESDEEKKLIRPFLVAYGTHLRRAIDPDCWISAVKKQVKNGRKEDIVVITDVRYENETDWIKSEGGTIIHVTRDGTLPANEEEQINDPILSRSANIRVAWPTYNENYFEKCKKITKNITKKLQI
jgi:hypothetical protein